MSTGDNFRIGSSSAILNIVRLVNQDPTTALGRVISAILMFAAIGIVWTLGALVVSKIVERRIKEAPVSLLDETKTVIKNRIDEIEKLSIEELEILITMIRSLRNGSRAGT